MKLKRKEVKNMKNQIGYKLLVIISILIVGCKKTNAKYEIDKNEPKITYNIKNNTSLDDIKQFISNKDETIYYVEDFKLYYNNENNTFKLEKSKKYLATINFENRDFDGVGFNVYLFQSKKIKQKAIVFEALADIGTAWYYAILLDDNIVKKMIFINEPRSNSDEISLNRFLSIDMTDDNYLFKFNKKYLAKYSTIPKNLKTDDNFIYLIPTNSEPQVQSSVKNFNIEKGSYFINAKVSSITTGETISIGFNLYVENDKKATLRLSTDASSEAYCEGDYKLSSESNLIKLQYTGEGICTDDNEESNIYIKKEREQYYIKSKRFENQDWQELTKD